MIDWVLIEYIINFDLLNYLLLSAVIRTGVLLTIKTMLPYNFYNSLAGKHRAYVHIVIIAKMDEKVIGNKFQPALFAQTSGNNLSDIFCI